MNTRKDRLKSIFGAQAADDMASTPNIPAPAEAPSKRVTSAAVKAMGLSLSALSQEAEEARRLREALAAGEKVVEVDPALIEPSPFADRLSQGAENDPHFEEIRRSIEEHGQQVPVLLRPHPDKDKAEQGFYQIAYGHRRVHAARALDIPVRAIIRRLDDSELVLAQGKENAERRDLSFIERAFFAKALLDHGFDRATAMAALSVHKSEMSRLIQVSEAVPQHVVRAIGPAPKAGRPRWLELGELIALDRAGLTDREITSDGFRTADSDARFQRLFARLQASARRAGKKPQPQQITARSGAPIGEVARAGKATRLVIPDSAGRGFADYLAQRLPDLHAAFEREGEGGQDGEGRGNES